MNDQPQPPRRKVGPYQRSLLELTAARREAEQRAAQQRLRRLRAAAAVTVVALVAATIGAVVWWLGRPGEGTPAAGPGMKTSCATSTPVRIWAPAAAVAALDAAAKEHAATQDESCADFVFEARPSAEVAAALSSDKAARPDGWVADSTVWVERATAAKKVSLGAAKPFATSPLVLAVARGAASPPAGADWKRLLSSSPPIRLSDPRTTTAGMLAVASALPVLGAEARQVLPRLAQRVSPSVDELFAQDAKAEGPAPAFPAAEVDVIAHNRSAKGSQFAAVLPGDQTASFQYSLLDVTTDQAKRSAIGQLRAFLASDAAAQSLAGGGLRPLSDPRAVPTLPGAVSTAVAAAAPSAQALTAAANSWQAATLDLRMLAVIDVSGSMKERAGTSTRIRITQEAAQLALDTLPPSAELGLWAFSIGIGEAGADHRELVPIGPLSDEQHSAALSQATASLSRRVGGGTGLYDTIWAGYQRVLDGWQPGRLNALVILTDGRNDDPRGLSLAQLTARLAKSDPKRPVAITTIGIGPDVDGEALSQISTMMHSEYYPALRPEDMQEVLAKALVDHDCNDGVCA